MKTLRILLAALLLALGTQPLILAKSYAAIAAGAVWEVRTGGSDTNGGCFDSTVGSPGTDFSQQNSAQINFTDLVIGGTTTHGTSVANPITSAMVGNCIYISAGTNCTQGFAEIISQSAGTATFDRALGTAAAVCTAQLGGALADHFKAWTGGPSGIGAAVGCNTIWVKSGTYTFTATQSGPVNAGGGCASIEETKVQGYQTTRGDNTGTRPLLTTATNSTPLWTSFPSAASYWTLRNIAFSNTAGTRAVGWNVQSNIAAWKVDNTVWDGFTNAIEGNSNVGGHWDGIISNSEFKNGSGNNPTLDFGGGNGIVLSGVFIHDGAGAGIRASSSGNGPLILSKSIIYKQNNGIQVDASTGAVNVVCMNSDIDSSTNDALTFSASNAMNISAENCALTNNGGYAVNDSLGTWTPDLRYWIDNAFFNNTLGNYHTGPSDPTDITLTATPYTNAAGGDFSLNATTGGGKTLLNAGFPGALVNGGTGFASIGALQPQVGGSGGGGHLIGGGF